jgi:PTS system glucitol/sorbitol-specific IIA component
MRELRAKYKTRVVAIGPLVPEFVEQRILVFFQVGAPPELAEFSILTEPTELVEDVRPGDRIVIDGHSYRVTAVGEVANTNLRNLGHLILKCNSRTEPELPGDVCTQAKDLPPIRVGTTIRIVGNGAGPSAANERGGLATGTPSKAP